jgi:hypothetical protein
MSSRHQPLWLTIAALLFMEARRESEIWVC